MKKRFFTAVTAGIVVLSGCVKNTISTTQSVEFIAHRGASYIAPENTMASVMLGWRKNADVEVDVHLSKDNRIMVIHDSTTTRTGNLDLKVRQTPSDILRKIDVGSFKSEEFTHEQIPFLEDVISTIPPGRKLYVEIKCGPEILPVLVRMLKTSGKAHQIIIIGFNLETVSAAKRQMPHIPAYWLKGTKRHKVTQKYIPHDPGLIQTAKDHNLDGLDLHYAGVDNNFMRAVKAAHQKLYVWTVDDPEEAARLIRLGVAGITTNRPQWLREQLQITH